jgi:serine/threonine protein kinase
LVDSEWEVQCQLPDHPYIHRAIDRDCEWNEVALDDDLDVVGARESQNAVRVMSLHFIVSPFIEGCDLWDLLFSHPYQPEPLPWHDVVDFGLMILSALVALHKAGIVHCDIKPENIMLVRDERIVKIVDFGLSRKSWEFQRGGTDLYLAPEVGHETQVVYPSRDIFAFGCLLFVLATCHFPEFILGRIQNAPVERDEHLQWLMRVIEVMTSEERMGRRTAVEWLEEFAMARAWVLTSPPLPRWAILPPNPRELLI